MYKVDRMYKLDQIYVINEWFIKTKKMAKNKIWQKETNGPDCIDGQTMGQSKTKKFSV